MQFKDVLTKCVGQTVVINNDQERQLLQVDEDFIVIQGGNPQMRLTEFIPLAHVVRVIRADYAATGDSSISIDVAYSGGDMRRGAE